MITYKTGDILKDDAQALVCPVNLRGPMSDLARKFNGKFPYYSKDCFKCIKDGRSITIGKVLVYKHLFYLGEEKLRYIISFPTMDQYRKPSTYPYISAALRDLRRVIKAHEMTSIAIPALGYGLGGLEWDRVRIMIHMFMEPLTDVDVRIYKPVEIKEFDPDLPL